ncbi:hypothetical protein K402DRAFT_464493 [Aulographum hederae CBS 113979]|uniref:Uncharacterized protein n=1 Tax=Aulographum hederae CBS 113979 TaxID=1176131 RepID=A0A6G1GWL7_9PEZI|nr:hypothetical protein K402DRAFT_464493 [Aulographum hederae CBS 113979]
MKQFFSLLSLLSLAAAWPTQRQVENNTLPSAYTLTAYDPSNSLYNGLKVQISGGWNLFASSNPSYCPFTGAEASNCPNGTEGVVTGNLYPSSLVPGGQDFYVRNNGQVQITVQHSHAIPPDAYPIYQGWYWTALPTPSGYESNLPGCPGASNASFYDCGPPSGFWNFRVQNQANETVGGLRACPSEFSEDGMSVYAVTPHFNATGCTELAGLGTRNYTGTTPAVWAYY